MKTLQKMSLAEFETSNVIFNSHLLDRIEGGDGGDVLIGIGSALLSVAGGALLITTVPLWVPAAAAAGGALALTAGALYNRNDNRQRINIEIDARGLGSGTWTVEFEPAWIQGDYSFYGGIDDLPCGSCHAH